VAGSLGGVYSTVEGLLDKMLDVLKMQNPFVGDSADKEYNDTFGGFLDKLELFKSGNKPFTLILDDAMDNCFVTNPFHPEKDPDVDVLVYDRTQEQNEEFGIDYLLKLEEQENNDKMKNE